MSKLQINSLDASQPDFDKCLAKLLAWDEVSDRAVAQRVETILSRVKANGDSALLDYTNSLDDRDVDDVAKLSIETEQLQQAEQRISAEQRAALETAAQRIRTYHDRQVLSSWQYQEADGTILGQKITPLNRVGVYVPGGKAAYPSTVLMNVIPAKVAGVNEIIMVVPAPGGELNDLVLASAAIAGVDRVFSIGGAQAVAALAYGTESVPRVDKIVGPGNIYVATAKKQVFGMVGIDMIAGPSEILIICDGETDPDWIAMDLFAQAEHDENAQSILISPDAGFLEAVQQSINKLIGEMPRAQVIKASLSRRGAMIKVSAMDEALKLANQIAPEHLELSVEDPLALLPEIHSAGAIFMGRYTAEALGDYCAGPNHVLPTSGTARFSSPLGVYDFQKRSSLIMCSPQAASTLGRTTALLARGEGLTAHARSAEYRIAKNTSD